MEVDLIGSPRTESLVWPVSVVPRRPECNLRFEAGTPNRYDGESPRALALDDPDEPLDDGDAAELADGSEPLSNPQTSAPTPEPPRGELLALVGNKVAGCGACCCDSAIEKALNGL